MYLNIQASLLRYCSDKAGQLKLTKGYQLTPMNLDAVLNEDNLAKGNIIGIEKLSVLAESDSNIVTSFTCAITLGTQEDPNNMQLSRLVDSVFKDLQINNNLAIYDSETGLRFTNAVIKGTTYVMPVQVGSDYRVFQSVTFMASVI